MRNFSRGAALSAAAIMIASTALPALAASQAPNAPEGAQAGCKTAPGVEVICAVNYAGDSSAAHTLDIYLPEGVKDAPVVIMIHGGGWMKGGSYALGRQSIYFAQHGLAAVSINYTLSTPDVSTWPTTFAEVEDAVDWVRSHADRYDIDGDTLGAYGVSAGGNLASLLHTSSSIPIATTVTLSAPMDLQMTYNDGPGTRTAVSQYLGCDPNDCIDMAADASPDAFVDRRDQSMLFFNSSKELVPLSQATKMDDELSDMGVPHELVVLPGTMHAARYECESVLVDGVTDTVIDASLSWLSEELQQDAVQVNGSYCPR